MEQRPRLSGKRLAAYNHITKNESRILVIGDLHCPFDLDEYFDFCRNTYKKWNCNQTIFIGDVIDNHYSSYHETSSDGLGGADELELAIERLQRYYKEFPIADVILGNHDRMVMRKAQTSAIPSKWIKSYKEVLEVPTWNFTERIEYDGVQYIHGEAGTARTKSKADMQSTVQGHLHTQAYSEFSVGRNFKIFGTQTGSGIDFDSYAMAYAKAGKKPAIGCAVVLGGHTPINCMMDL
tara:strand:- start:621 stop:1331 length:711 start_codon:yes stop_codon:yes gene_type:complete